MAEKIFGHFIVNSEGRAFPVRYIDEHHVREDLGPHTVLSGLDRRAANPTLDILTVDGKSSLAQDPSCCFKAIWSTITPS